MKLTLSLVVRILLLLSLVIVACNNGNVPQATQKDIIEYDPGRNKQFIDFSIARGKVTSPEFGPITLSTLASKVDEDIFSSSCDETWQCSGREGARISVRDRELEVIFGGKDSYLSFIPNDPIVAEDESNSRFQFLFKFEERGYHSGLNKRVFPDGFRVEIWSGEQVRFSDRVKDSTSNVMLWGRRWRRYSEDFQDALDGRTIDEIRIYGDNLDIVRFDDIDIEIEDAPAAPAPNPIDDTSPSNKILINDGYGEGIDLEPFSTSSNIRSSLATAFEGKRYYIIDYDVPNGGLDIIFDKPISLKNIDSFYSVIRSDSLSHQGIGVVLLDENLNEIGVKHWHYGLPRNEWRVIKSDTRSDLSYSGQDVGGYRLLNNQASEMHYSVTIMTGDGVVAEPENPEDKPKSNIPVYMDGPEGCFEDWGWLDRDPYSTDHAVSGTSYRVTNGGFFYACPSGYGVDETNYFNFWVYPEDASTVYVHFVDTLGAIFSTRTVGNLDRNKWNFVSLTHSGSNITSDTKLYGPSLTCTGTCYWDEVGHSTENTSDSTAPSEPKDTEIYPLVVYSDALKAPFTGGSWGNVSYSSSDEVLVGSYSTRITNGGFQGWASQGADVSGQSHVTGHVYLTESCDVTLKVMSTTQGELAAETYPNLEANRWHLLQETLSSMNASGRSDIRGPLITACSTFYVDEVSFNQGQTVDVPEPTSNFPEGSLCGTDSPSFTTGEFQTRSVITTQGVGVQCPIVIHKDNSIDNLIQDTYAWSVTPRNIVPDLQYPGIEVLRVNNGESMLVEPIRPLGLQLEGQIFFWLYDGDSSFNQTDWSVVVGSRETVEGDLDVTFLDLEDVEVKVWDDGWALVKIERDLFGGDKARYLDYYLIETDKSYDWYSNDHLIFRHAADDDAYFPVEPPLEDEELDQVYKDTLLYPLEGQYYRSGYFFGSHWEGSGCVNDQGQAVNRLAVGVDLGALFGDPVYAVKDGKVVYARSDTVWGGYIVIDHGSYVSVYSHVSPYGKFNTGFEFGEISVKEGEELGLVASGSYGYGSHLDFKIRNKPFDEADINIILLGALSESGSCEQPVRHSEFPELYVDVDNDEHSWNDDFRNVKWRFR